MEPTTKLLCDSGAGPTSRKCHRVVRFKLTYPQISLVQHTCADHLASFLINGADEDQDMAKCEVEVLSSGYVFTEKQMLRIAWGACHEIIRQALDNGELEAVDIKEFLPDNVQEDDVDYAELQRVIEGHVMSDMWEEQAKRD